MKPYQALVISLLPVVGFGFGVVIGKNYSFALLFLAAVVSAVMIMISLGAFEKDTE